MELKTLTSGKYRDLTELMVESPVDPSVSITSDGIACLVHSVTNLVTFESLQYTTVK